MARSSRAVRQTGPRCPGARPARVVRYLRTVAGGRPAATASRPPRPPDRPWAPCSLQSAVLGWAPPLDASLRAVLELSRRKVLVTGADGFIGSHLTEELVRLGCAVRALVFYNSAGSWGWLDHAPPEIRSQIEVVMGDVRDAERINGAVKTCEVVYHLAALVAIPFSYCSPDSYRE